VAQIRPVFPESDRTRQRTLEKRTTRIERAGPTAVPLSAATSLTFDGLDGDAAGSYRFDLFGRFTTTAFNRSIRLKPNNDATVANYRHYHHRGLHRPRRRRRTRVRRLGGRHTWRPDRRPQHLGHQLRRVPVRGHLHEDGDEPVRPIELREHPP